MTNREWLSKMSDRELAEKLVGATTLETCDYCIYEEQTHGDGCGCLESHECDDGIEAWLREEH